MQEFPRVTSNGLLAMAKLNKLRRLKLIGFYDVSAEVIRNLGDLDDLESLDLDISAVTSGTGLAVSKLKE